MRKIRIALMGIVMLCSNAVMAQTAIPPVNASSAPILETANSARDSAIQACSDIKKLRDSAVGPKVAPADKDEILAQAREAERRLGVKCGGSGASSGSGKVHKPAALVQAELDLKQAREAIALLQAAAQTGAVKAPVDCETKSYHLFVGNDGKMVQTCKGLRDEVYVQSPPPVPQPIMAAPAIVHQLGGGSAPVSSATQVGVSSQPVPQAGVPADAPPVASGQLLLWHSPTATASNPAPCVISGGDGQGLPPYCSGFKVVPVNMGETKSQWLVRVGGGGRPADTGSYKRN